jgi:hypothetical protein
MFQKMLEEVFMVQHFLNGLMSRLAISGLAHVKKISGQLFVDLPVKFADLLKKKIAGVHLCILDGKGHYTRLSLAAGQALLRTGDVWVGTMV